MLAEDAERLVRARFGLEATATPLHGEHDRNFLLEGRRGERHLLKLAPPDADPDAVAMQDAALEHLRVAEPDVAVPRLVARDGGGVRVLSWIDGTPWAEARHDPEAVRSLGRAVASLDGALAGFEHPSLRRPHPWSLLEAGEHLRSLPLIREGERRDAVEAVLRRFAAEVRPRLGGLGGQAIHNDANEHNVLVDPAGRVCGLIDFGDLCWAPRVCGLAVACAYAMTSLPRPVADVVPLVSGYHEVAPLAAAELDLLFDLACTRLAVSVAMAARQSREQPGNEYLLVSQDAVSAALRRLARESRELAHVRLRAACGYEAVPTARAVRNWLGCGAADPSTATSSAAARRGASASACWRGSCARQRSRSSMARARSKAPPSSTLPAAAVT